MVELEAGKPTCQIGKVLQVLTAKNLCGTIHLHPTDFME